jgi:hypothetical protein
MTIQAITATFPASGQITLQPGKYFFCTAAPAGGYAFVIWGRSGSNEQFGSQNSFVAPVGLKVGRVKGWTQAQLWGVAGQSITYFYGDETVFPQDITDVSLQIASISGTVVVSGTVNAIPEASANGPTDHADVLVATTIQDTTIPVNAARRFIRIGSLGSNAPATLNIRVRAHGGAAGGVEIQPGTFVDFYTQAALDVLNPDANGQTYWWTEYT